MIDVAAKIHDTFTQSLKGTALAGAQVRVDTIYNPNKQFSNDVIYVGGQENSLPTARLQLDIIDQNIAFDLKSGDHARNAFKQIAALAPYVEFEDKKPEDNFGELYKQFLTIQKLAPEQIPEVLGEAFQLRTKHAKEHTTDYGDDRPAINTQRTDTEVVAGLRVPKELSADEIEKLIEANKTKILEFMGAIIDRKHPNLAGQTKGLDFVVETQSYGDHKVLELKFRSQTVMEAMKKDGGIAALSAEEHQKLKPTNPLMALNDGPNDDPKKAYELQKIIARSIFQTVPEVLAKVGHAPDLLTAFKILPKLKNTAGTSPEVIATIDKFLKNDFFKTSEMHKESVKHGIFEKQSLDISKGSVELNGKKIPALHVGITIPENKWNEVIAELSGQQKTSAVVGGLVDKALAASAEQQIVAAGAAVGPCPPGQAATAVGMGAATKDGVGAAAAAACIPPQHAAATPHIVGKVGPTEITQGNVRSFLNKIGVSVPSSKVGDVCACGPAAGAKNVALGA